MHISFIRKRYKLIRFRRGYLIDKNNVLHVTPLNGVKLSPLAAMGAAVFYEVINENNMV